MSTWKKLDPRTIGVELLATYARSVTETHYGKTTHEGYITGFEVTAILEHQGGDPVPRALLDQCAVRIGDEICPVEDTELRTEE